MKDLHYIKNTMMKKLWSFILIVKKKNKKKN